MVPLLVGIAILLVVFLVPLPYVLYVIGLIAGIVLLVYGGYVLLARGRIEPTTTVRRRYWW